MNYDRYGEIINGDLTYKEIARLLKQGETVGIGWTDEMFTHLDIVFKLGIKKFGNFQRGIRANYLFISIISHTSYAFSIENEKLGDYIQEKIQMNDICGDKVKELINGIIRELNK